MAKVFGITGGIACGKSAVTKFLRSKGIRIVDADEVSRSLVEPGQPVLDKIVEVFGNEILNADGTLSRKALGARVWSNIKDRKALERIMHAPIRKVIEEELAQAERNSSIVGYDAALLIETGEYKKYRPLIVVACYPETQLQRLMERNHLTKNEAMIRINSQMPVSTQIKFADFLIDNNGTIEELHKTTLMVWDDILRFWSS